MALAVIGLVPLTIALLNGPDDAGSTNTADTAVDESVAAESPSAPSSPEPSLTPEEPEVVEKGDGEWTNADGGTDVVGKAGTLLKYKVVVEGGIGQDAGTFADVVDATLSDERGWTAGKQWRFQRVDSGKADFTVYLASPETRAVLCGADDTFTSCRNGDKVVINLARWLLGVEDYGAPIEVYGQYVINHEVGHRLGHGHELCPGKNDPAPVMQQQTLGLHGCEANAWPYPNGKEYHSGPVGEYT